MLFYERSMTMKEFWNIIQTVFAALGGWIGYFLGGCDGLLIALIVFITIDYVTGLICAISDHKLSSEVGFQGIAKKIMIILLVGVAHLLDKYVFGEVGVVRTAVIFYYISNEGISVLENASHLGLPIPQKLKKVLQQLHDRGDGDDENIEEEKDG